MFKYTLKGNVLTVEITLDTEPRVSSTGKSLLAASTGGFANTGLKYLDKPISFGANAILK